MQAVLLSAGKSSRFYPYNQDIEQKSLISMMGKTLLEHTMDSLYAAGIRNAVIVMRKNSRIPSLLASEKRIKIQFVEQPKPLGMGDALLCVKEHLAESFFVMSPYHMDIADFAKDMLALQEEKSSVVLVKEDTIMDRYGNVMLQANNVIKIVEKPTKATSSYRLAAIYLLTKEFMRVLQEIPSEEYHFEKALDILAKNKKVKALITNKATVTLKYAWDLLGIKDYLLAKIPENLISKRASIAKDAQLLGTITVANGATIMEGVIIKGPAYIGKNVLIGNRAILRGGVIIEENSVVGSQMELKNTLIMKNTTTHAGFIGDSVVGHDTRIAGGIVTANVRLDRQPVVSIVENEKVSTGFRHFGTIIGNNVNVGIRAAIMPGIIIGNNVVVGPSTTVMQNIADSKKYYTKFSEVIEKNNEK